MASAAVRLSPTKKTRWNVACLIPMSRTPAARSSNAARSSAGRPKSLTSIAPETLNRSCIIVFISALRFMPWRKRRPSRGANTLAGTRKIGTSSSATKVICHERIAIVASTSRTMTALPTTLLRRSVKACWAPMMSLFSRLMSAPVWVREKNAMGIAWTWAKTFERMS